MATIYGARGTSGQTNVRARQRQEGTRPPCRQQSPDYAPVSSITVRRRLLATNVAFRKNGVDYGPAGALPSEIESRQRSSISIGERQAARRVRRRRQPASHRGG